MITSGMSVIGKFNAVEDPFAELSEDSDESLLAADEDEGPEGTAAKRGEVEATRTDPVAPPEVAATNAGKLLRRFLPSGLALLLVAAAGMLISFLMDSVLHKDAIKTIKKEDYVNDVAGITSQGSRPSSLASLDTDEKAVKAACEASPQEGVAATVDHRETEDEFGCTALHCAAHRGAADEVGALLAQGAAVNRREAWEETPLHFAARTGSVEVCELLLAHGAELNPVNESDCTPLLVAAQAGNKAVCKLLLDAGAHAGGASDSELPPTLSTLMVERIIAEVASSQTAKAPDMVVEDGAM